MSDSPHTGSPEAAGPPPQRFGESDPFTVGLEEELLVVDAETLQLAHVADKILAGTTLPRNRIDHEAFLAEVEVRSEPAGSVHDAIEQLKEGRREAIRAGAVPCESGAGDSAGATIMGVGLHPDARLFDVELDQS